MGALSLTFKVLLYPVLLVFFRASLSASQAGLLYLLLIWTVASNTIVRITGVFFTLPCLTVVVVTVVNNTIVIYASVTFVLVLLLMPWISPGRNT